MNEAEPWRVWKARDMESLLADCQRTCFVWTEQHYADFAELRDEIESLIKTVASHMDSFERRKFYCAKRIWHERNKTVPSAEKHDRDRTTWAQWFEQMYREPLETYAARAAAEGVRERIKNYELATYGFSPLAEGEQKHLPESIATKAVA